MALLPNTWLCFDVSKISQEFWFADATLSAFPVCCFVYIFIYILCLPLPLSCQFIGLWARGEAAECAHSFFFFFNFILFFNFTILYWFCHISKWIRHRLDFTPWNPLSREAESHKGSSPEDYQIPCLERISRARHPFCKWGHWASEKGHNVLKKMQLNNQQNSEKQLSFSQKINF